MNTSFLRFYAAIMATFTAMFVVCVVIIWSDPAAYDPAAVEQALGPGMRLARARLEAVPASERNKALGEIARAYDEELVVTPLAQLNPQAREGLTSRRAVSFWIEDLEFGYLAIQLDDNTALRLGPLADEGWRPGMSWLWAALSAALAFGVIVFMLLAPLTRHLRALQAAALAVGEGDWTARVELRGDRHQLAVARAFNTMVERLVALVESRTALLRSVSHELRTPLARLRFRAELLQEAANEPDRTRHGAALDNEVAALDDLVQELLTYSRAEAGVAMALTTLSLSDTLDRVIAERRIDPDRDPINIKLEVGPNLCVLADRRLFARAIGNLVENALRYANSRVRVSAQNEGPNCVRVLVEDDGPGIPEPLRARAFAPFDTLRESPHIHEKQSNGLGLAIVDRNVHAHGGKATIIEGAHGGCGYVTHWPRAERLDG